MIHAISLAVALVLNATANLMIKAGVKAIEAQNQTGTGLLNLTKIKAAACSPWIIGGVVCFALNLAAYTFALRRFPVSLAYPIMVSVGYAIIACGAAAWFSEKLTAWQMVGVGVILAGVWLVASGMVKTA